MNDSPLWNIPEVEAVHSQLPEFYPAFAEENQFGEHPIIGRLGHSCSLNRPEAGCCDYAPETDTVKCFYLFGETILEQTHPVGKCPWKLL